MEAATVSSPPALFRTSDLGVLSLRQSSRVFFPSESRLATRSPKNFSSTVFVNHVPSRSVARIRRGLGIRASLDGVGSSESSSSFAPLQLQSPIGQFLSQIIASHPHLLPAAVDQQLEQLNSDRYVEKGKEEASPSGSELILYRRIAEVKANERKMALEEILYALIVQKFMDADVPLVPTISQVSDPSGRVQRWSSEEDKLQCLHSPEAFEMIQNHLRLILGQRLGDSDSVASISKFRIGQVYAASVLYGYFLKRVDQRYQLEKKMKTLAWSSDGEQSTNEKVVAEESKASQTIVGDSNANEPNWSLPAGSPGGFGYGIKPTPLRTYVMSLDPETLQRYATIRSKEGFSIIEKQTEALFGRPEIAITPQGTIDASKEELITISFGGLRRLVLEAVTFGSFLWDVESYVDSRYQFVTS